MSPLTRIGELVREVHERKPPSSAVVFSVSEGRGIIPQTEIFTKQIATTDKSKYRGIQFGDVVFNPYLLWNRAVGVCFAKEGGCVSPAYPVLRPLHTGVERFLHYFFRSPTLTNAVNAIATGSVTRRRTAPLTDILDLAFELPSLESQKTANHLLSVLDEKLELSHQMSGTLKALAQTLFGSWFVDFNLVRDKAAGRVPVGLDSATVALFPDQFEDSRIGPIPKDWSAVKLNDLAAKIGSGATPRGGSSVYIEEGIALIRSQNVYDHEFDWDGLARITDKSAAELDGVEVKIGDILFNLTGASMLRTCIVDPAVLPARVNQHVAIIRAKNGISSRFLHLFLLQPRVKAFLSGLDAGATRQAVTKGHLEALDILLPPTGIMEAFDRATENIFKRIEILDTQSRALAALRDALLPKLLSGELRVKM